MALSEMIGRCEITPTGNVWRRGAIALCQQSARAPVWSMGKEQDSFERMRA